MSKDLTLDTKYDLSVKSIEFFIFRGCGTLATPLGGRKVIFDPRNRISMSKNLTLDKHDLSVKSIEVGKLILTPEMDSACLKT